MDLRRMEWRLLRVAGFSAILGLAFARMKCWFATIDLCQRVMFRRRGIASFRLGTRIADRCFACSPFFTCRSGFWPVRGTGFPVFRVPVWPCEQTGGYSRAEGTSIPRRSRESSKQAKKSENTEQQQGTQVPEPETGFSLSLTSNTPTEMDGGRSTPRTRKS